MTLPLSARGRATTGGRACAVGSETGLLFALS